MTNNVAPFPPQTTSGDSRPVDDTETPAPRPFTRLTGWLLDRGKDVRAQLAERDLTVRDTVVGALGAIVVLGVFVFLAVKLIQLGLWLFAGDSGPGAGVAGHWLARQSVVRIVSDPIGHWLAQHTAGLPISSTAAAVLWTSSGVLVFIAAAARSAGAQIVWPLYGAATTAMVWIGTTAADQRPVAAGLAGLAWALLSIPALRRRHHDVHVCCTGDAGGNPPTRRGHGDVVPGPSAT